MLDFPGFREATPKDTRAIEGLLYDAGLPVADVGRHIDGFVVLEREGAITACGAIEVYYEAALLRSVAVEETARGGGIGRQIIKLLESKAREAGASELCLFTITAGPFFAHLGYADGDLEDWPWEARGAYQYMYVSDHREQFAEWGLRCMFKTIGQAA